MSRMDKYHNSYNIDNESSNSISRLNKNENLYKEIYTNKTITEFTTLNSNVVDLSDISSKKNSSKREEYQKSKLLNNDQELSKKASYYQYSNNKTEDLKEKNYNINDILDNAHKNKNMDEDDEKERHLKSVEYNILSDLSQEKINEYRQSKQKKLSKAEEENLEELIHTITSNSLKQKIDDELLNDLMPDSDSESVISEQLLKDIEEKKNELSNSLVDNKNILEEIENDNTGDIDNSFYTHSMELKKEDLLSDADLKNDNDDEEEDLSFIEDSKLGVISKIGIFLLIILVLGIVIYVVVNFV